MASTDDVQPVSDVKLSSDRMIGQVKWFNNKAGYGFITVSEGDYSNKDIFVHYTSIRVTNSQYKYLVQGEYVEFNLTQSSTPGHEFQANDISGIRNGSLMCETRRNNRDESAPRSRPPADRTDRRREKPEGTSSGEGAGAGAGEFTQVRRRRPAGPKKASATPRA